MQQVAFNFFLKNKIQGNAYLSIPSNILLLELLQISERQAAGFACLHLNHGHRYIGVHESLSPEEDLSKQTFHLVAMAGNV